MKTFIKFIICSIIVSSCGGNDDSPTIPTAQAPGPFNLVFPDNNLICTEGDDLDNNKISIDFMWSASSNATSYILEINNLDTNQTINESLTTTSKEVTLPRDTQFSWKVTATLGDEATESAQWNFYSEGIAEENFAPFPAEITTVDNLNGSVEISWTGSDLDDDIETYELYFGTDAGNLELVNSTDSDEISSNQPITYGTIYYIELITIDARGNSSSSKTSIIYQG